MKIEECIAILENIRENISSDGEISVGLSITALTDAICYAQTCKIRRRISIKRREAVSGLLAA